MTTTPEVLAIVSGDELVAAIRTCRQLRKTGTHSATLPNCTRVEMIATDSDLICRLCTPQCGVQVRVIAARTQIGTRVTLSVDVLHKALKSFSQGSMLTLSRWAGRLRLEPDESGEFRVDVPLEFVNDEAHPWIELGDADFTSVDADVGFKQALAAVATHASHDSARVNINTVLFDHDGCRATIVATDGHRMAVRTVAFAFPKVDLKLPSEFVGLLPAARGALRIAYDDEHVVVVSELTGVAGSLNLALWAKLSKATFPPYRQVIPKRYWGDDAEWIVVGGSIVRILDSFRRMFHGLSAPLTLTVQDKTLVLENRGSRPSDEAALGHAELPCVPKPRAPQQTVSVNPVYLHDAVAVVGSCKLWLGWTGPMDPIVVSNPDRTRFVIVMPTKGGT